MRRLVSIIGITLLALLVGGWGSVFAAAFCPHMAATAAEDHSCCLAKIESAGEHHSNNHQATHGAKTEQTSAACHLHGDAAALSPVAATCAHCVGQNELPATPASVRELTLQKRGAGKMIGQAVTPLALPLAVSIQPFAPTQHAPPAPAGRKHLLLSVFLI